MDNDGEVIGQEVSDKTLRDFDEEVERKVKPTVRIGAKKLATDDGRDYICVAFEGFGGPYSCEDRYRVRVNDRDVMMTPDEIEAAFRERADRREPWDERPSERPLSDVDEGELRAFVERGRERGRVAFEHESVEGTLASPGLLAADGRMLNAAAVLFCPPRPCSSRPASSPTPSAPKSSTCGRSRAPSSDSGVQVGYERVPFGTRLTFTRPDPFAVGRGEAKGGESGRPGVAGKLRGHDDEVRAFLAESGPSTSSEVASGIDVSVPQARRVLATLVELGAVVKTGSSVSTRYRLPNERQVSGSATPSLPGTRTAAGLWVAQPLPSRPSEGLRM